MNRIFLIAGLTSLLVACNEHSNHKTTNPDSTRHDSHSPGNNKNVLINPVTETMKRMMDEMHHIKPTGNNDVDFAAMMIEHHKGAVEMAKVEIAQGNNSEMKAFAQKVIDDQDKEIVFMQEFISKAFKTASSNAAEFQKALKGSMKAMMEGNTQIHDDTDKDFAAQMIPHHQSAVDMAMAYLQFGKDTGLRTLSQNIIRSQEKEISWLKDWLRRNTN